MDLDGDLLPISGLQHLAFCPRQWGLIHLEQLWAENRLTAEGKQLHERADLPGKADASRSAAFVACGCDRKNCSSSAAPTSSSFPRRLTRSSTSEASASRMTATQCSFARRPFAWKRCSQLLFPEGPSSTATRDGGWRCSSPPRCELVPQSWQTRCVVCSTRAPHQRLNLGRTAATTRSSIFACLAGRIQPMHLPAGSVVRSRPSAANRLAKTPSDGRVLLEPPCASC